MQRYKFTSTNYKKKKKVNSRSFQLGSGKTDSSATTKGEGLI